MMFDALEGPAMRQIALGAARANGCDSIARPRLGIEAPATSRRLSRDTSCHNCRKIGRQVKYYLILILMAQWLRSCNHTRKVLGFTSGRVILQIVLAHAPRFVIL